MQNRILSIILYYAGFRYEFKSKHVQLQFIYTCIILSVLVYGPLKRHAFSPIKGQCNRISPRISNVRRSIDRVIYLLFVLMVKIYFQVEIDVLGVYSGRGILVRVVADRGPYTVPVDWVFAIQHRHNGRCCSIALVDTILVCILIA